MFSLSTASISIALLLSGVSAQSSVAELVSQLRSAPTEVDRFRLLNDSDVSLPSVLRLVDDGLMELAVPV